MKELKYITMFDGYDPKKRFCEIKDKVSRTIQDAIVDVPSLLKMFGDNLPDLFNKYNNGLLFESEIGVFVDELNAAELKAFNEHQEKLAKIEADKQENERLFEEFKAHKAKEVLAKRLNPVDTSSSSSSSSSSEPAQE